MAKHFSGYDYVPDGSGESVCQKGEFVFAAAGGGRFGGGGGVVCLSQIDQTKQHCGGCECNFLHRPSFCTQLFPLSIQLSTYLRANSGEFW